MTTYVLRDGKLVEKSKAEPLHESGSSFNYISDHMDPLFHHAALKTIDSKSEFRRETKNHGCVEVGNDPNYGKQRLFTPKLDKRQRVQDIQRTIYNLRNGIK
jgi:hypothetical protein